MAADTAASALRSAFAKVRPGKARDLAKKKRHSYRKKAATSGAPRSMVTVAARSTRGSRMQLRSVQAWEAAVGQKTKVPRKSKK